VGDSDVGDSDIIKIERGHIDGDVGSTDVDSDVGRREAGREGGRELATARYVGKDATVAIFWFQLNLVDWFVCLLLASLIPTTTEQY